MSRARRLPRHRRPARPGAPQACGASRRPGAAPADQRRRQHRPGRTPARDAAGQCTARLPAAAPLRARPATTRVRAAPAGAHRNRDGRTALSGRSAGADPAGTDPQPDPAALTLAASRARGGPLSRRRRRPARLVPGGASVRSVGPSGPSVVLGQSSQGPKSSSTMLVSFRGAPPATRITHGSASTASACPAPGTTSPARGCRGGDVAPSLGPGTGHSTASAPGSHWVGCCRSLYRTSGPDA